MNKKQLRKYFKDRKMSLALAVSAMLFGTFAIQASANASVYTHIRGRAFVPWVWNQGYITFYPWCTVDFYDEHHNLVCETHTNWLALYWADLPSNHTYTIQAHSDTQIDPHYSQTETVWATDFRWWQFNQVNVPTLYCW